MFAASKTDGAVELPDAQFNYVTMLLHGDGTNGAQNNTFIDSSTNNLSITRSGSTTQGSFSPYGSNWSNYFLGTGNYLSLPSNAAFNLGTGAYTVEAWVYLSSYAGSNEIVMFCNGNATGAIACSINTGGQIHLSKYGVGQVITGSSGDVPLNQWNHIAYVRTSTSSNDTKLYVNGVVKATGTDSNNWNVTTTPTVGGLTIGGFGIIGYISNVRVVKGTAVYTGAFTPSTIPLTAISGTSLLTCADNRFIDNSSNNFTITPTGTPSVQRFNPFGTATAYSTSVIGGSGYFNGSSDWLTTGSAVTALGSGNWTVEFWFYTPVSGATQVISDARSTTQGYYPTFYINSANKVAFYTNSADILVSTNAVSINVWTHIALVKNSTTTTCYINGVTNGTYSDSNTYLSGITTFGSSGLIVDLNAAKFTGYISNYRSVVGTAVYTTTFTPPTAPLTAITNTSLLLSTTNGAIFDNAMINNLLTVGNAQISTSVRKYGTGSLSFDGTGDYLFNNPATTDLYAFGSGDFTIEFWIYTNIVTGAQVIYDSRPAGVNSSTTPTIYLSGASLRYFVNGSDRITGANLTASTWYHVAICRSGTSTKLFVDGTQSGSTYTDSTVYTNTTGRPGIGVDSNALTSNFYNGYIDDLRITKGFARYTANFTAPNSAFTDKGPV
jgi:hypothetical protein